MGRIKPEKVENLIMTEVKKSGTRGLLQKEIAERIMMTKMTVAKHLRNLEAKEKIFARQVGNYKMYYTKQSYASEVNA